MSRYNPKKLTNIIKKDQPKKTKNPEAVEKLQPISYGTKLGMLEKLLFSFLRSSTNTNPTEDYNSKSILDAIDHILSSQWNFIPTQLNPDFQAHIQKYRDFLPRIVSRYQLYSIFPDNQTFIDQEIDHLFEDGKIKRVLLQENEDANDLIIKTEEYIKVLDSNMNHSGNEVTKIPLKKFTVFLEENPKALKPSKELISSKINEEEIALLVKLGFLQIIPQSSKNQLKISIPKYGYVINLYQNSKKFILRTINATKFKEMKHNELYEKWERNKNKFKDFKGLNINWILHWLIGEGTLEVFQISDGKAYKTIRN